MAGSVPGFAPICIPVSKANALLFCKDDKECRLFFRLDLMQMVVDSPAGDGICADQDYLGNELLH